MLVKELLETELAHLSEALDDVCWSQGPLRDGYLDEALDDEVLNEEARDDEALCDGPLDDESLD